MLTSRGKFGLGLGGGKKSLLQRRPHVLQRPVVGMVPSFASAVQERVGNSSCYGTHELAAYGARCKMISAQLTHRGWCCPTARVLTLREDYLSACDGSLPEALLLQAIAWKTRADDPEAWLQYAEGQWASEVFGAFNKRTQRLARQRLMARGLIEPDGSQARGRRCAVRLRINGSGLHAAIRKFEASSTRAAVPQSRTQLGQKWPSDYGNSAPVTTAQMPQSYIGSKNSFENGSQKKLASFPAETNSAGPDPLTVAVQDRLGNLEINGEPIPVSVVRNLNKAISKLPQEDLRLRALQNLGRFCGAIRSGRRPDVGWGVVVTDTKDFVELQLAHLANEPSITRTSGARSTAPVCINPKRGLPTPSEAEGSVQEKMAYPDIWEPVKQRLSTKLVPSQYRDWIARNQLGSFENRELIIFVPDSASVEWIRDEYKLISEAIGELNTSVGQIRYVCPSLICA